MIIFPAIDLKDGCCVRLSQGNFDESDIFSTSPVAQAKLFEKQGAEFLHIVDLDGAKDGVGKNSEVIQAIRQAISIPIQVGGGIRDEKTVKYYLDMGISRVILGTAAIENLEFLKGVVSQFKDKIAVSIDAKNGKVATRGWLETTEVDSISFCQFLESIGVKTLIYTDIAKDGMMAGANLAVYQQLKDLLTLDIIASGGVSGIDDIKALKRINMYGAIVGKAIYLNKLNLAEIIPLAK